MKEIRLNQPGDGEWVMAQVEGHFTTGVDHVFGAYRDGRRVGGIVACQYLGASMTIHMAGSDPQWASRDLLWMVYDYVFNQLGCRKALAPVRSNNYVALAQDMRAGYRLEAIIRDAYPDAHMMLLSMTKETCPWLRIKPQAYKSGSN